MNVLPGKAARGGGSVTSPPESTQPGEEEVVNYTTIPQNATGTARSALVTTPDAGASDAGAPPAPVTDAGPAPDAGRAPDAGSADAGAADAGPTASPCNCPTSLTMNSTGPIAGSFGISQYWPVTNYWGSDTTLGQFDTAATGGRHYYGHKFQIVGQFSRAGTGGLPTFRQMARLTTTRGGSAGAWFDDMNYTDAGGGVHNWDPNAEAGSATNAVRRTIATDKIAYTDPPAVVYTPGSGNSYRKLEFDIFFRAPSGCSCGQPVINFQRTQEIEVVNGVPRTITYPGP
jgi:hypothetical protein